MAFRGKKWKYISLAEYYHSGEWRYYCELWGFRKKEMNIVGQCIRGSDQAVRVGRIWFQTAGNTDLWDYRECEHLFPGVWWREIRWICLLRDWQQADWRRAVGKTPIRERSSRRGLGKINMVPAIAILIKKTDRGMQCVPVFLKLETDCFIFAGKL